MLNSQLDFAFKPQITVESVVENDETDSQKALLKCIEALFRLIENSQYKQMAQTILPRLI